MSATTSATETPDTPDTPDTPASPTGSGPADLLAPTDPAPSRGLGRLLLIGGAIGAVAAFVLVLEKISALTDPGYVPSCSIDPVLSCGSIMRTAQASVFGFPNPLIGMATFPLVALAGALVVGRVELPRWFWLGLQFGTTAGVAFVHWLIVQSLGVIHALCPYCMVVWTVMIPIFWFVTTHNLAAGHLELGAVGRALVRFRYAVLAVWYLAIVVAIIAAFPDYWASTVGL